MKVTAVIPDKLIDKVRKLTGGHTITESIIIALEGFIAHRRLGRTIHKIKEQPFSEIGVFDYSTTLSNEGDFILSIIQNENEGSVTTLSLTVENKSTTH